MAEKDKSFRQILNGKLPWGTKPHSELILAWLASLPGFQSNAALISTRNALALSFAMTNDILMRDYEAAHEKANVIRMAFLTRGMNDGEY